MNNEFTSVAFSSITVRIREDCAFRFHLICLREQQGNIIPSSRFIFNQIVENIRRFRYCGILDHLLVFLVWILVESFSFGSYC